MHTRQRHAARSTGRRAIRPVAFVVVAGLLVLLLPLAAASRHPQAAWADGLAPCTTGSPPYPYAGYCGTFDGDNTWYGSYGPGFPTAQGWAFCADPPASGGDYPAPDYDYVPGGAPQGAGGDWNALGFAFSQAQAAGYWGGEAGQFTSDQIAAAGKFLYDTVVWGSPVPSMDDGTLAAYDDLDGWFNQAQGTTGTPQMNVGVVGGGDTIDGSAFYAIHVSFPGTGNGFSGLGILVGVTNATLDSPGGPTFIGASTNGNGNLIVPIFVSDTGPVTVTVSTDTEVGQVGIGFYHATSGPANTQYLAGFPAPINLQSTEELSSNGQPELPEGTVSIEKQGNDTAYYGLAGATFNVVDASGAVVATLTTEDTGSSAASNLLPFGTYTVQETTAPVGYQLAPSQSVTIDSTQNTVVEFTGSNQDFIAPATVNITKEDSQTGAPLAGAVFDVKYDSQDDGTYDEDLGTCTTGADGQCSPSGNDGADLLPGNYEITEISAPPGYYLEPADATQTISLSPGQNGAVTFFDPQLAELRIFKGGNDTAYTSVAGAVFTVAGPAPSTTVVATVTIGSNGESPIISGLMPGEYTVTETTAPAGYTAAPPTQVAVTTGVGITYLDIDDTVIPASLTLIKLDAQTMAPLAGAVLDVKYATGQTITSEAAGPAVTYNEDLGTCVTGPDGQCAPTGNDGPTSFLPGDYEVTEVSPPPGYPPNPTPPVQYITLTPGQVGTVTFLDQPYLTVSFQKAATGNFDPAQVIYAGAVIDVYEGSPTGALVTTCTTDSTGECTTPADLIGGGSYCWTEVVAPPGLAGGASGCFTASESVESQPIEVDDPGEFVAVEAKKVAADDPSLTLSGAVFDLYRVDGGNGPDQPTPPAGAATEPGETWVARATSGPDGIADFPLQFPGYAYCVVEEAPPPNYLATSGQQCTPVLTGTTATPPPVTVLTASDATAMVTLQAHKYNSLTPDTGIPGATYDLYVEGPLPPGLPLPSPPQPAPTVEQGDTWMARGTTDDSGDLSFTVPAGYAYCLHEVSAPTNYVLDPALHCTAVLTTSSSAQDLTIALPETVANVYLTAHKYDALQPDTVIPGATYELLVQGSPPPNAGLPPVPAGAVVPSGDTYWAEGTSDANGVLSFAVPAGYSWCLHELVVPSGYQLDSAFHCTAVLDTDSPASAMVVALPEQPAGSLSASPLSPAPASPSSPASPVLEALAYTGGPSPWLPVAGGGLTIGGAALWAVGRRRRKLWRRRCR